MKIVIRSCGVLAVISIFLYAFFGIPIWASVEDQPGRGFTIFILHVAAITASLFTIGQNEC